jgi:hypothetical protein
MAVWRKKLILPKNRVERFDAVGRYKAGWEFFGVPHVGGAEGPLWKARTATFRRAARACIIAISKSIPSLKPIYFVHSETILRDDHIVS